MCVGTEYSGVNVNPTDHIAIAVPPSVVEAPQSCVCKEAVCVCRESLGIIRRGDVFKKYNKMWTVHRR